jgi:hypothetical protein
MQPDMLGLFDPATYHPINEYLAQDTIDRAIEDIPPSVRELTDPNEPFVPPPELIKNVTERDIKDRWEYYHDLMHKLTQIDMYSFRAKIYETIPATNHYQSEWTWYGDPADSDVLILDIEGLIVKGDNYADMACALGLNGVFGVWINPGLYGGEWCNIELPENVKLVVNHEVSFDRSYIEQRPGLYFWDTIAPIQQMYGMGNKQEKLYRKHIKSAHRKGSSYDRYGNHKGFTIEGEELDPSDPDYYTPDDYTTDFIPYATELSLDKVLYFLTGESLSKGVRDNIIAGGSAYVRANLADVVWYCFDDVIATLNVHQHSFEDWWAATNSWWQFGGWLIQSVNVLPLTPDYWDRVGELEAKYLESVGKTNNLLLDLANIALANQELHPSLDWTLKKVVKKREWYTGDSKQLPAWYIKFCDDVYGATGSKLGLIVVNSLLKPTYLGKEVTWCNDKRCLQCEGELIINFNPMAKTKYMSKLFTKESISRIDKEQHERFIFPDYCNALIAELKQWRYYVNLRKGLLGMRTNQHPQLGKVNYPGTRVCGTVSRRTKEKFWLVAPHPKPEQCGSDARMLVKAPPGYVFVEADVRSQEYALFSAFADRYYGFVGSAACSVVGAISDIHNVVSGMVGGKLERVHIKNYNYGRVYGQSEKGAAAHMVASSKGTIDFSTALELTTEMSASTKGIRTWNIGVPHYEGGIESHGYNYMSELLYRDRVRSPLLGVEVSEALQPCNTNGQYRHMLGNWTIQTSGAEMLFIVQCCIHELAIRHGIRCEIFPIMTAHDEYTWCCLERDKYLLGCIFNNAHYLAQAQVSRRLGLDGVAVVNAWFPEVQIDKYLRKNSSDPCINPTCDGYELGEKNNFRQLVEAQCSTI